MTTTPRPSTAAGRALRPAFEHWLVTEGQPDFGLTLDAAILAIEAEAAQAALDAVARKVEGLTRYNAFMAVNEAGDRETIPMVELSAVLAILRGDSQKDAAASSEVEAGK